ncbi:MAG: chromosome segregation protein ScpA [Planctomycetes bacterium]|nr:chromosome segregation protein ScpA [Planctomycetota bacterium]
MSDYRVHLDIFSGPMDLLLYLIRKDEVDIYDVSLTKIIKEYLHYLELLKKLDVDLAGDFLVMASTLLQIKSTMLLPKVESDDVDGEDLSDPRTELIRQLLEYKKFKDAANLLSDAAIDQKMRYHRPNTIVEQLKDDREPELDLEQVSVWDLLDAFDSIIEATGGATFDISHIIDDTPIDLYEIEILHRLQVEGPMSFVKIFECKTSRSAMVGLFLALLELIRNRLVWVEQPTPDGDIHLKALTDEPAEQAVQKAILATESELLEQTELREETLEAAADTETIDETQETPIAIEEIMPKIESVAEIDIETEPSLSVPIAELPAKNEDNSNNKEQTEESDSSKIGHSESN